jgi:hypothetical protein
MSAADERFPNAAAHFAMRRQKKRNAIAGAWVSYTRSMVESPALRVLSIHAIRVMHRLEIEHMSHGGAENGRLIVTHDQFIEWGVERKQVGPAIRELAALGFVEITERGYAGAAGHGKANRFRLTYVNTKAREEPSNEWRRIATLEDADATAKVARSDKDSWAADKGRRSAKERIAANGTAKPAKKVSSGNGTSSVPGTGTDGSNPQFLKQELHVSVPETGTSFYISGGQRSVEPPLPYAEPQPSERSEGVPKRSVAPSTRSGPPHGQSQPSHLLPIRVSSGHVLSSAS